MCKGEKGGEGGTLQNFLRETERLSFITCGRRPAGLLVTLVVVVVVVGGITFIHGHCKNPCMVLTKSKAGPHTFVFLFFYFKCPCMV